MLSFSLILALASAVTGLRLNSPTETHLNFQEIVAVAEAIQQEYVSKTWMVPYHIHGVLPSETLALMSTAMATKIDVLVESGTAYGQNAELMARFLLDKPVQIYTIDNCELYGKERCQATSTRLKNFTNLSFIFPGDTFKELPKILAKHQGQRIGVFIDGPKGMMAADLCRNTIKASVDVKFCAMHDVSPTSGEPAEFVKRVRTWERQVLLSYETAWHDHWNGLDVNATEEAGLASEQGFLLLNETEKVKDTAAQGYASNPGLAILAGMDTMQFGLKGDDSA